MSKVNVQGHRKNSCFVSRYLINWLFELVCRIICAKVILVLGLVWICRVIYSIQQLPRGLIIWWCDTLCSCVKLLFKIPPRVAVKQRNTGWDCVYRLRCFWMRVLGRGRGESEVSVDAADSGNFTCRASNVFLLHGIARTTRLIVYCKSQYLTASQHQHSLDAAWCYRLVAWHVCVCVCVCVCVLVTRGWACKIVEPLEMPFVVYWRLLSKGILYYMWSRSSTGKENYGGFWPIEKHGFFAAHSKGITHSWIPAWESDCCSQPARVTF